MSKIKIFLSTHILIILFSSLAFTSGFIGLAYELIYVRAFGLINGDLYTTYAIIVLTFISGMAMGNLFGFKLRKDLPFLEIGGGLYACLFSIFLLMGGYNLHFPTPVLILLLFVPAFIVGLHVPLYSYYLKKIKFDIIYALYHFGAIISLLILELLAFSSLPLSWIFMALGLAQIIIGLSILFYYHKGIFRIQKTNFELISFGQILKNKWCLFLGVFLTSLMSFYFHFSLLRIILYYQFLLRPTFSFFIITSILFVTLGALLSNKFKIKLWIISVLFFVHILSILIFLPNIAQWLGSFNYQNLIVFQFALNILAFSPLIWATVFLCRSIEEARPKLEKIDIYAGLFLCISSIGNILGYLLTAITANLITSWLIISPLLILVILILAIITNQNYQKFIISLIIIMVATYFFQSKYDLNFILTEGISTKQCLMRDCEQNPKNIYQVDNLVANYNSLVAVFKSNNTNMNAAVYFTPQTYVLDGYLSHVINYYTENSVGIFPRRYFSEKLNNSYVIGIGTGQTVSGVAMISKKTTAVDINAAVFAYLPKLEQYNHNLLQNSQVELIRDDGMNYLKKNNEKYDLILNTATNMFTYGVAKLHTKEFLSLVKKHLLPNGIYVSWLDCNSIRSKDDLENVVGLHRPYFKYIDAHYISDAYILLVSYDEQRPINNISHQDLTLEDAAFISKNMIKLPNYDYTLNLQDIFPKNHKLKNSTMDYPKLEKIALNNYLKNIRETHLFNLRQLIDSNPKYKLIPDEEQVDNDD